MYAVVSSLPFCSITYLFIGWLDSRLVTLKSLFMTNMRICATTLLERDREPFAVLTLRGYG